MKIEEMISQNRADCTGCYSCYNSCKKKAITMTEDSEGFRYPQINSDLCVKCGACDNSCPVLNPPKISKTEKPDTFAAINDKTGIRLKSSSGGLFNALADYVLAEGGVVFGAGFDDKWEVCHQSAENEKELSFLQVSKYLQSRIEDVYQRVRCELKKGRKVLFSGTPCQCAALKVFLKKDFHHLLLVDFICHGVPSPGVWRRYLKERVSGNNISEISFRNKNLSWERYLLSFRINDNKYIADDLYTDLYLRGFLQNLYLRPSCHECHFCKQNRPTDITLADFWGVSQELPEAYDGKGTSLIFVHSEKGQSIFSKLAVRKWHVKFEQGVKHNISMLQPAKPSSRRTKFFSELMSEENTDIMRLLKKYTRTKLKTRIKSIVKKILIKLHINYSLFLRRKKKVRSERQDYPY